MSGIQYGIYGSHSDAANQTNAISSIVLHESFDEAGNPKAFGDVVLSPGTYYVREIGGGVGYQIDQTIYTANVNEAGYDWFYDGHGVENLYLQDKPVGDPVMMIVQKLDSETGEAYGVDDPSGQELRGAQFNIRYYNSYFNSVEEAEASGDPTRSWVVETRENGSARLYQDYLLPGSSELYHDELGFVTIPLGTVLIQETKAPDGYLLPSANLVDLQQIRLDPLNNVTRLNPIIVLEEPHVLSFEKIDAETREALGGAEFTLYRETSAGANTWEEVITKTTDEQGRFTYSPIAVGSYKLVEIKPPQGYQSPAESGLATEHRFTIDESTTTKTITATNYKKLDINVQKTDKDTHEPLADTEFTVYSYPVTLKSGAVTSDVTAIKTDDPAWREVARVVTDKDGKATFANLPFGYYQLKETRAHPNYADYEESGGAPRFVKLDKYSTNETQVFENMAIQVAVEVYKKTIAITSSGLDGTGQQAGNNVGTEEYLYHFGARSNSNVWVDEFIITDDLSYVTTKGYRMTTLWTGTSPADMDFDNKMAVLYKTNMTSADERVVFKSNPLAANPHNPNNPNKNMTFSNTPGWRIWAEGLSTTHQTRLDVSDLALNDGEYITGLKIVYGGVAKEFFSGRGWLEEEDPHTVKTLAGSTIAAPIEHWSYSVVATEGLLPVDEFGDETIMKGTVTADLARNDGVLKDNDNDAVETRVIEPFYYPTKSNGIVGTPPLSDGFPSSTPYAKSGGGLPRTGQSIMPVVAVVSLVIAGFAMILPGRRRKREAG
ncbi:MAG TPA: hypothetical protein DEB24_08045 [Coriobacteriia bacterium]|nr:hypothetical protein [Coriobacteriia bacterium]